MNLQYRLADGASNVRGVGAPRADVLTRLFAMMAEPNPEFPPDLYRDIAAASREQFGTPAPHSFVLPWSLLQRDLTSSTAGGTAQAGFLASTIRANPVRESLRDFSVAAELCTFLELASESARRVPVVYSPPAAEWVAEGSAPTEASGNTQFSGAILEAREIACTVTISRRLQKLSPGTEIQSVVRNELLAAVGRAVDRAVLQGDGVLQPLGIAGTSGVLTRAGASLDRADLVEIVNSLCAEGVRRDRISFVVPPATASLLGTREAAAGGGEYLLTDDDRIVGRRAYVSTQAPAAALIAGDFSGCLVGTWGGLQLTMNPYKRAADGSLVINARAVLGVVVPQASTFCVSTSVS